MDFRRFHIRRVLPVLLALAAGLYGCRSLTDLVLDDEDFRDDMISKALEGTQFRIQPDDYPSIRRLFSSRKVVERRAAVVLAGQTGRPEFYPLIMDAALDENPEVAREARGVIGRNPENYRSLLSQIVVNGTPEEKAGAAGIFSEMGSEDVVPLLIGLFGDSSSRVREEAASAVWKLTGRDNPFLRDALNSSDVLVQAAAVRALGLYGHPEDMELFLSFFSDENALLRREAQQAVLRQGGTALDALHAMASGRGVSYRSRLSALELIQGLRAPASLVPLIRLLEDDNPDIVRKAQSVLATYGSGAVEVLGGVYRDSPDDIRLYAVELLGDIPSASSVEVLASALDDDVAEIRNRAFSALVSFGETAWPVLHGLLLAGDYPSSGEIIPILIKGGDSWLLSKADGSPNTAVLPQLIRYTPYGVLSDFMRKLNVPALQVETVLSLREAWDASGEFSELEQGIASGSDAFLYAWYRKEQLSAQSRQVLQQSFTVLHRQFQSSDSSALDESRRLRNESRRLAREAREWKERLDAMEPAVQDRGRKRIERYQLLRELLVRVWEYVAPEYREVAEVLYQDMNLNSRALYGKFSLAE